MSLHENTNSVRDFLEQVAELRGDALIPDVLGMNEKLLAAVAKAEASQQGAKLHFSDEAAMDVFAKEARRPLVCT